MEPKENNNLNKKNSSESLIIKILISSAVMMLAVIILYNAFFVPEVSPVVISEAQNSDFKSVDKGEKSKKKFNGKININTASEDEISENLSGIGPSIAKRIVDYRKSKGGFSSPEELMNIKGVGKKVFEKIKNDITV